MGYMAHHAVVAVGSATRYDPTSGRFDLPSEWSIAIEDFRTRMPEEFRHLLVGPIRSVTNLYDTYAFMPDGSKEGWDTSDVGDGLRDEFVASAIQHEADWVCVRFGGDEPDLAHIVGHDGRPQSSYHDQATR